MNDFTVKEIADFLEVSKTTISKYLKAAAIEADYVKSNRQYFSIEKTIEIIKAVKPDFDLKKLNIQLENSQTKFANLQIESANQGEKLTNSQEESENLQTESANSQTSPSGTEIELMRSMVETLQEQLKIKDKQIAAYEEQIANQSEQIKDYSARLREAMELTKGQQYIAAADKTAQLLEHREDSEPVDAGQAAVTKESISPAATIGNAEPREEDKQAAPQKKSFWKKIFGR